MSNWTFNHFQTYLSQLFETLKETVDRVGVKVMVKGGKFIDVDIGPTLYRFQVDNYDHTAFIMRFADRGCLVHSEDIDDWSLVYIFTTYDGRDHLVKSIQNEIGIEIGNYDPRRPELAAMTMRRLQILHRRAVGCEELRLV